MIVRRALFALLCIVQRSGGASVRRPSQQQLSIDFEGPPTQVCDFALGSVVTDQYAANLAQFAGPGYGSLNGGVVMGACALSGGAFPPLGNASFGGGSYMGFSTLHVLSTGEGQPIQIENRTTGHGYNKGPLIHLVLIPRIGSY